MLNNYIFGNGLFGQAVHDVTKKYDCSTQLFSGLTRPLTLDAVSKCSFLVRPEKGRLSDFYHGVTPFHEEIEKTFYGRDFFKKIDNRFSYNFVPFFVPRPDARHVNGILCQKQLSSKLQYLLDAGKNVFLCLGAFDNICRMHDIGLIEQSDFCFRNHIVVRIGQVSHEELNEQFNLPHSVVTSRGVLHPVFNFPNFQLSFRPGLGVTSFDPGSVANLPYFKFIAHNISMKKIATALHLKFGLPIPSNLVDVFAQISIDLQFDFASSRIVDDNIVTMLETTQQSVISLFHSFQLSKVTSVFDGIHWSYSRENIKGIPENIQTIDNSLVHETSLHPTLLGCARVERILAHYFSRVGSV